MSAIVIKKFGQPCLENELVFANIPFTLKIAWDKNLTTTRIKCHSLVKKDIENIFRDILSHYGKEKISELGIDMYGGCYNCRNMRGGSKLSMHSWGIAIDLDPTRNLLRWGRDKAQFAKAEYKPMIDIFYKHGWISLGREKNYDWMHFQKNI